MTANSGCVTGILIDISNVNEQETVKSSSESTFSLENSKILNLDDLKSYETTIKQTETLKVPQLTNGFRRIQSSASNSDDSELIENEIFDFDSFVKSPNSSFSSDYGSNFGLSTKDDEYLTLWSSNEEMSLNTEELAEVFREATTVAVKLENYVQKQNRTPIKSPNHMKLFLERSAQKKLKLQSPKEDKVKTKEFICETDEMPTKTDVKTKLISTFLETTKEVSTVKDVGNFVGSTVKTSASSLTNFRTKVRSSSVGPVPRSGPLKAVPIVTKQANTSTFRPSSSTTKSALPSRASTNPVVAVTRSNSAVTKPATRPVLNRCNSFHSDIVTVTPKTFATPKLQSRRSFSGVTPPSATPTVVSGSKRRSLLTVPTPTRSSTGRATPSSSNKKTFDGSRKIWH